jgi:hypothetical protein
LTVAAMRGGHRRQAVTPATGAIRAARLLSTPEVAAAIAGAAWRPRS